MDLTKEQIIDALRGAPAVGYKLGDLAVTLSLDTKTRHRLKRLLDELADAGTVERGPGARFLLPGQAAAVAAAPAPEKPKPGVTGMIRVHPAGYGFVERDDGNDDVFVPARFRGSALDGDKVRVTTYMGYKGTEGRVEEVLARGRAKLTGVLRQAGRQFVLEPDDPRIAATFGTVTLDEGAGGAHPGQCVVAEISRYPTEAQTGPGALGARVTHVLGSPDDPRTEVVKIVTCADIPYVFPEDVLTAGQRAPQALAAEDFADRVDLRDRAFLTIDPETARDFDDAVCLEDRPGGGLRLWVAVADVSHYVRPGTALDREARIRGCSVYLPDRAIPMLPPELSSQICSLMPEVDRLAMVVRIDLDAGGAQLDKAFCAAVIRSRARLDYAGVAAALGGDLRGARARYGQWLDTLRRMHDLSRKMRARRRTRGSLDFDIPEATVILDEDNPLLVRDVRRSKSSQEVREAYQLVEEFMLAANEAVAGFFGSRKLDTVWRVHDVPSIERLTDFATLAEGFGLDIDPERAQTPLALAAVLAQIAGRPFERALSFMLLRSLKQATYDVVNVGHFGLASSEYLHFTSPIRRYPDLIVHRLLKVHLRREGIPSGGSSHAPPPLREVLQAMAAESSGHERRAAEAEREVKDMYRAFLMRDRIDEELEGVISGVTNFGVFVECKEPFVEGLIRSDALGGDSFEFDDRLLRMVGRRSGRAFTLGDEVKVRVLNVSVPRRRIDFALVSGGSVGVLPVEPLDVGRRPGRRRGALSSGERRTDKGPAHGQGRGKPGKPAGGGGRRRKGR